MVAQMHVSTMVRMECDFPCDALMMHNDNNQKCPINNLSVSLYNFMFIPFDSFLKSPCEQELDQN